MSLGKLLSVHENTQGVAHALPALITRWLPAIAWALLIFALSAQSDLRVVPADDGLDFVLRKLGHFVVFGILAILVWRALCATPAVQRPSVWALALTLLYAITDEVHQGLVPSRVMSMTDVAIDGAGALAFLVARSLVAGKGHRRSTHPSANRPPGQP
ncbi:MAG: VanZ family protein [Chloroflexota bacterium]|nr:VanZ family protein [Chloroflexota bacterium]